MGGEEGAIVRAAIVLPQVDALFDRLKQIRQISLPTDNSRNHNPIIDRLIEKNIPIENTVK
jgi:hypothetical protein